MQSILLFGGNQNHIPLPAFTSCTIEVGVRLDPDMTRPGAAEQRIFAFGFSTAGPTEDNGPGLTVLNSGLVSCNDDLDPTGFMNYVDAGGFLTTAQTVFKFFWDARGVTMERDGVTYPFPLPTVIIPESVEGCFATFAFDRGGLGNSLGYLDYIDIQGEFNGSVQNFWTELRDAREII